MRTTRGVLLACLLAVAAGVALAQSTPATVSLPPPAALSRPCPVIL